MRKLYNYWREGKKLKQIAYNVHCYISVAEKHKTMLRLMTKDNKYKQIIEFNPITAIEYSSCYKPYLFDYQLKVK